MKGIDKILRTNEEVTHTSICNQYPFSLLVEKCKLPVLKSYAMQHVQNCRAFWKCILGKSYGMCCPEGKRYKPYVGCTTDPSCTDACPPMTAGLGSCDSRPIFDVPNKFEQYVPGHGWIQMPCPLGTQYNPAECGCTMNVPVQTTDKGNLFTWGINFVIVDVLGFFFPIWFRCSL